MLGDLRQERNRGGTGFRPRTYLIVSDIDAARNDLVRRGVQVSEAFHGAADTYAGTDEPYLFGRIRSMARIPGTAATVRSPRSMIRMATAG